MPRRTAFMSTTAIAAALLLTLTSCSGVPRVTSEAGEEAAAESGSGITAAAPAEESEAPAAPGIGTPLTVGAFEFTVNGVADIGTTIGSEPLTQNAQGTYLQVDLSVANVGNQGESFFSSYVKLVDDQGRTFDSDSTAGIYLDAASIWVSTINPGNTVTGPIVFDVPAGTVAVAVQVSDNMFSDGELISLG